MNKKIIASALLGLTLTSLTAFAFTDDNDINIENKYAVKRLSELNIISGNPDGSFSPDKEVTRGEMAKMLAVTLNKGDITEDLTTDFTDTNGHWAEKYIAYCVDKGILAGKSEDTFAPNDFVTLNEASKMMLISLGMDATKAELIGPNWEQNTIYYATSFGISKGVSTLEDTDALSKENAAQVISNTLSAKTVVENADTYDKSEQTFIDVLGYQDTATNMPRAIYDKISEASAIRPNLQSTTHEIELVYDISLDNLEYAFAAVTPISPGIDEIFIAKVKDNRLNAVESALETYREKLINEKAFYPQDLETAKSSRIFTNDAGYIMFISSSAENGYETAEEIFNEFAK